MTVFTDKRKNPVRALPTNATVSELLAFVEQFHHAAERSAHRLAAIKELISEEQRRYSSPQ